MQKGFTRYRLILLMFYIVTVILVFWTFGFKIFESKTNIEIKSEVPVGFNVPSKKEIKQINERRTFNEDLREAEKNEAEEISKKLVEKALNE